MGTLALGQQRQVGPYRGQPVERRVGLGVLVAAVAQHLAEWVRLVGRHEHRVVGDGGERRRGRPLGLGHRAMRLAEHARQNAVADRRLIGPAIASSAVEQGAQAAQSPSFVVVTPQPVERGRIVLQRRLERLGGEREDPQREIDAVARGQRRVGDQRGRAGRAVDQRQAVLGRQENALGQIAEEVGEGQNLAGAAVAHERHPGQRAAAEHGGDRLGDMGRDRRVALEIVGEPRQHHGAHQALGRRLAVRGAGRTRRPRRLPGALLGRQRDARHLAIARGDAVDGDGGVAIEQHQEALLAFGHAGQRRPGDAHVRTLPGDAADRLQRDVGAGGQLDGHGAVSRS